jgi:hypothetical protein
LILDTLEESSQTPFFREVASQARIQAWIAVYIFARHFAKKLSTAICPESGKQDDKKSRFCPVIFEN